ncbi:sensor histidine kinase [Paenibacillus sp. GCM10027627]|uniref:cache domain-containing sensor histidine kinase n=1 Tax=unclassified Paenibacillus TaxID=185978 RepID=UPI00362D40E0
MSLRFKLFAAFLILIILPLFLLGIAAYYFISQTVEKNYAQQSELTLRALRQNVEFVFSEMNKVTDSTIASIAMQQLLDQRGSTVNDLSQLRMLELNEIQKSFRELLINHPSVSFALMYPLEEQRAIPIYTKDYFEAMPFSQLKEHPLYQEVRRRSGQPVWVGPYEYPELTGDDPLFTQIRVVKDLEKLQDRAVLLVQTKNTNIDAVFRYFRFNQEHYNTRFFIVNKAGKVLYDSSEEMNGGAIGDFTDSSFQMDTAFASNRQSFYGEDSIVSSVSIGRDSWHLVSVTSWNSLSSEIVKYAWWLAGFLAVTVLLAMYFLLFSVNRIAKTIVLAVRLMRRVEEGELSIRMGERDGDELGLLAQGLNSLIGRIQYLLGRVKQEQEQKNRAEMQLLQTQIKPHFIFNTLESINILARQNEGKKVSQMVLRLANILRISFKGQEEIPLFQEIEHVKSYLEIQKFRFADSFNYTFDIPDSLLDCYVQKLTLQPLVENCIQHGFDGLERMGHIVIRAREERERLLLSVEDNGVGMGNETLAHFQYMASDDGGDASGQRQGQGQRQVPGSGQGSGQRQGPGSGSGSGNGEGDGAGKDEGDAVFGHGGRMHNPERRGLGIRSVADRIRIQYGANYGLFICSLQGRGTSIQCIIPKMGSGDTHEIKGHAG